jgi:hypothetical protein
LTNTAIDDDSNERENNLPRAWKIIFPILIKHGVRVFKIVRDSCREDLYKDEEQHGKQITVYPYKQLEEKPEYWESLMKELTRELNNGKIIPGSICTVGERADIQIKGSSYFSYRNDGYKNLDNPFEKVDLTDIEQPKCKEWKKKELHF